MTIKKRDVRSKMYLLNEHHDNVLKKVAKMQSKSNTAGNLLSAEINNGSDILVSLFSLFLNSIEDANEDKKYFLDKLRTMKKIGEAMSGYVKELNEIIIEVNNTNKNVKNYSEATLVGNTIKKLDRMIIALDQCSSILNTSREEIKKDAMNQLRSLKIKVKQIKKKLEIKIPTENITKKLPIKKIAPKKRF